MTKKEKFIEFVEHMMNYEYYAWDPEIQAEWSDAIDYLNGLKMTGDKDKPQFTPNGKLVLKYAQDNKDTYNNLFKAKDIGEGLGISSRTASGAMRKLVSDGYIEKVGENPVIYSLTQKGIETNLNNIEVDN